MTQPAHLPATRAADKALPNWPGRQQRAVKQARRANGSILLGSLSEQHAQRTWADARRTTMLKAPTMGLTAPAQTIGGLATLDFVSRIARHITQCGRCQQTGRADTQTPAAWLLWALGQQPTTKRIMGPILRDRGIGIPATPPR